MKAVVGLFAAAALVALLYTVAQSAPAANAAAHIVDADFHAHMRAAGLSLDNLTDLHFRYGIYRENMRRIEASNARAPGYTLGAGPFVLYSFEEFTSRMGMHTFGAGDAIDESKLGEELQAPEVNSVDWRGRYDVTPVKNQTAACNAGYAMASVGAIESSVKKYRGSVQTISAQQLIDCTQSYGNFGCRGGYANKSFDYIQPNGIAAESVYPYTGAEGTCQAPATYAGIKGYFGLKNENGVMSSINSQPVVLGFEYNTDLQHYTGGIYKNRAPCGRNINHYGVGVGYVFAGQNNSYWIIKNSFGASWGESGYLRLEFYSCGVARNSFNQALRE